MRDFMKSLFIYSDYIKSLKKQALNFILVLVSWLSIYNLFMESHAILKAKAQLRMQMKASKTCLLRGWLMTRLKTGQLESNLFSSKTIVPIIQGSCVYRFQPCLAVELGLDKLLYHCQTKWYLQTIMKLTYYQHFQTATYQLAIVETVWEMKTPTWSIPKTL